MVKKFVENQTNTKNEWKQQREDSINWTQGQKSDRITFMDITKEWTTTKGMDGTIIKRQEYIINGTVYQVDGKHVISRLTEQEREIATMLSMKYGKKVELVPQVMYPQGIQTPDYLIDGERFDLKSFKGVGKNLIYNMVSKKKNQAPNFIFDFTKCPLSEIEIERQIENVYSSTHTRFIEKIVVVRDGEILKVYERQ